jgi:hypothetical protein
MLPTPEDPAARTIERDTLAAIATTTLSKYLGPEKYLRKRLDPPIFTNSADPSFES